MECQRQCKPFLLPITSVGVFTNLQSIAGLQILVARLSCLCWGFSDSEVPFTLGLGEFDSHV